jgi:hypothetical protein
MSAFIQEPNVIYSKLPLKVTFQFMIYDKIVVNNNKKVVSNIAPFFPMKCPKQPAQKELSKGNNIFNKYIKSF